MAPLHTVKIGLRLEPDEETHRILVSLGWTPPGDGTAEHRARAALQSIWEDLEQSDEVFSAARLRRIIVESGALKDG